MVSWYEHDGTSENIYVKRYRTNSWQPLSNQLDDVPTNNATTPSIDLNSFNDPVVAWEENNNVFIGYWDPFSASWDYSFDGLYPTVDTDTLPDSDPSLAIASIEDGDTVHVAFTENNGTSDDVYVVFDIDGWVQMGQALDNDLAQNANQPSLAVRGTFAPYIAFTESDGTSSNIYVKKWNDVAFAWEAVGGALDFALANNASNPSLAIDSLGNPVVAWQEVVSGSSNIYVKRWSGTSWVSLKTQLDVSLSNEAITPSLALRPDDRAVVAWSESGNIYVKRWTGNTTGTTSTGGWVAYTSNTDITPADVSVSNTASNPHLILAASQPLVTFEENGDVFVRRWRGTIKWQTVTPGAVDRVLANQASHPAVVLQATATGVRPIVTWQEDNGTSTDVFVSRF